jgi:hypothetical protein
MPTKPQTELREAIMDYKAFLETGTRCTRTTYTDPSDGSGYVPDGKVECICISGIHAVEQLRPLRTRLQKTRDAAFTEPSLRPALDALPGGCYFFNPMMDFTVNPPAIAAAFRTHVDKPYPQCEYVPADVLEALDRVLARLPVESTDTGETPTGGETAERKGTLDWFCDNFLMPLIVVLISAFLLWWIGLTP